MWNISNASSANETEDDGANMLERLFMQQVVPVTYSIITILGFVGNLLVILVVLKYQHMKNSTNTLILFLAVADLLFIVCCVPWTAMKMAFFYYPFGSVVCQISEWMVWTSALLSIYTMVLMSLDRYLAIAHPVRSMRCRTPKIVAITAAAVWAAILALTWPLLFMYRVMYYQHDGQSRARCMNMALYGRIDLERIFYLVVFAVGYVVPLSLIMALYGLMLRSIRRRRPLLGANASSACADAPLAHQPSHLGHPSHPDHPNHPAAERSLEQRPLERERPTTASVSRTRLQRNRKVTRMVIVIVTVFAMCWLQVWVVFIVRTYIQDLDTLSFFFWFIIAQCCAYMNSCLNPILYAFLSEPFRQSFRKILCCHPVQERRMDSVVRTPMPLANGTSVAGNAGANSIAIGNTLGLVDAKVTTTQLPQSAFLDSTI